MIIPIKWSFQRQSIMPIIEVKGESPESASEFVLIQNAVEIIEKAKGFKGVPYQGSPSTSCISVLTVSFSLIFPSEEGLRDFMENVKNNR